MPGDHVAVFYEMAVILALATAAGIVGALMKQPLIIAFIVAGILAGPTSFDLIKSVGSLNALADIASEPASSQDLRSRRSANSH